MKLSIRALSMGGLMRRSRLLLAGFIILASTIIAPLSPSIANADAKADMAAKNKAYYSAIFLRDCLVQLRSSKDGAGTISQSRVDENLFLVPIEGSALPTVSIGLTFKADDGVAHCNDTALVKSAIATVGFANGGDLLKAIGYHTEEKKDVFIGQTCTGTTYKQCTNNFGTATVYVISGSDTFNDTVLAKHPQQAYVRYAAYLAIFNSRCKLTEPPSGSGDAVTYKKITKGEDGKYSVVDTAAEFALQTTTTDTSYIDSNQTTVTTKYGDIGIQNFDYSGQNTNCRGLLSKLDDLAGSVAQYNTTHASDPISSTISFTGATEGEDQVDCAATPTDPSCVDGESNCNVEGIGWIICPVMNFVAGINDTMYKFLSAVLEVHPFENTTSPDKGLYGAWNTFRSYANVLFIVAFLFIVYSQITSIGITNYGVKKLLPKLIVAAILVNVSYYLCQFAVDLSNILGVGLKSLFDSIGAGISETGTAGNNVPGWLTTTGAILATAGGLAGVAAIALAVSVPVLLAGLVALLSVALILIARQAIIILLIAISPIAFVAWLLPNTEKWFKKWWEIFLAMLMLFPVISLLYGGGALAAIVLSAPSTGQGNSGWTDTARQIAALGAAALPLLATIPLLQGSLKATGALGAKLSGMSSKATGRVGSKVKDTSMAGALAKQYTRQRSIKRAQVLGGQKGVGGFINKRLNRMTGNLGKGIAATGASTALKLRNEDVDNAAMQMQSSWQPHEELGNAKEAYAAALKSGDVVQARAAQKILLSKGGAGTSAIRDVVRHGDFDHTSAAVRGAKADLASAGLKGKDAGLNAWSFDSKERALKDVDSDTKTYDSLTDAELSTQSAGSVKRALRSGGIDQARAKRIVDNGDLQGNLTGESHTALTGVGSGGAPPTDDPDEKRYTDWTASTSRTPNP